MNAEETLAEVTLSAAYLQGESSTAIAKLQTPCGLAEHPPASACTPAAKHHL